MTYLLGFWGKKQYHHDFILIQDDILIAHPELVDYWKKVRGVKFVGVFVYEKERPYSNAEWNVIKTADWIELAAGGVAFSVTYALLAPTIGACWRPCSGWSTAAIRQCKLFPNVSGVISNLSSESGTYLLTLT